MNMKETFNQYKYFLIYLFLTAWYCRGAFSSGNLLFGQGGDTLRSHFAWMCYFHYWIQQGVLPLWNNLSLCGQPLFYYSPLNLFFLASHVFNPILSFNLIIFISIALNGIILYLFLLRKGVSPFGSFVGGLVWMLVTSDRIDFGFFFFPLSLWLSDRYLEHKTRRDLIFLILSLAFYALNTNAQYVFYGGLCLLFYMLFSGNKRGLPSAKHIGAILIPFVFSAALVLFQYLRIAELLQLSTRSTFNVIQVLLPTHYPLAIFPRLYECYGHPEWSFVIDRAVQYIFSHVYSPDTVVSPLSVPYAGIFPVIALMFLLYRGKAPSWIRYFVIVLASVILYVTFNPLLYSLIIRHVPFLKGMYSMARMLDFCLLSLCVLSAAGVDIILDRSVRSWGILKRIQTQSTIFIGALFGLLGIARWIIFASQDMISDKIRTNISALKSYHITAHTVSEFQQKRIDDFFSFFDHTLSLGNPHLIVPLVIVILFFFLLQMYHQGKIRPWIFKILLSFAVMADIFIFKGFPAPALKVSRLYQDSDIIQYLKQDSSLYRVMILEDETLVYSDVFLGPESNLIFNMATPDGYEPFYQRRYVRFYTFLTQRKKDADRMVHPTNELNHSLADLINCKYILTSTKNTKLDHETDYRKVFENSKYRIYENLNVLPRAFAVRNAYWAVDEKDAEGYVKNFPDRLKNQVVLEGKRKEPLLPASLTSGSDQVNVITYQPNQMVFDVRMADEGYLVLTENDYPGWKAYLDDQEVQVYRADYTFRAVHVTKGRHTVKFVYKPEALRIGLMSGFASMLLLMLVLCKMKSTGLSRK